jgi:hypothetical protein
MGASTAAVQTPLPGPMPLPLLQEEGWEDRVGAYLPRPSGKNENAVSTSQYTDASANDSHGRTRQRDQTFISNEAMCNDRVSDA